MSGKRSQGSERSDITYTVFLEEGRTWKTHSKVSDMHRALRTAEEMANTNRYKTIKVEKAFLDPENSRQVRTTILEKSFKSRPNFTIIYLLILAAAGGLVAFAVTYFVAGHYLH